ncbi:MAG: stage II sporulation protein M [Pyrinomonadaceae bacterium]
MNRFIEERKNNWERLEGLLAILETSSLRGLSRTEVREFGELYRRAAADLAIARAETRDPKLVNYLNSLVIRAHGKIYRAESQGVDLVRDFFVREFPQTFRRNWRYIFLAFAVFTGFGVISFILTYNDFNFAEALGVGGVRLAAQNDHRWWLDLNEANQIGSSSIMANNILVSLRAFAFGAFFGIGTIYVLVFNGLYIGGILGVCYKTDAAFGNQLVTFMIGHGVIELSCIFIAAGAGMMIGYSLVNPGDLTRVQALKKNGLEAVRLAIGCACLLVIAGIIEGFLSPSSLPAWVKFGTGILTGVAMYSYLLLAGRERDSVKV